jgi:hypothetical protein
MSLEVMTKMKMMFVLMAVLVVEHGLHAQTAQRPAAAAITINAAKFDAVYRAGKAVGVAAEDGQISVLQFRALLLTLQTEASIASDKASGRGEVTLASMFNTAALRFELLLLVRDDATKHENTSADASAALEKATGLYLAALSRKLTQKVFAEATKISIPAGASPDTVQAIQALQRCIDREGANQHEKCAAEGAAMSASMAADRRK